MSERLQPRPQPQLALREGATADGRRTLALDGELDLASVDALKAAIEGMAAQRTTSITLDLRGLTFIDSTGLAAIVLAGKLCETNGYEFALIPGGASTQRLFELTGLIDALPFRDGADADADRDDGRDADEDPAGEPA